MMLCSSTDKKLERTSHEQFYYKAWKMCKITYVSVTCMYVYMCTCTVCLRIWDLEFALSIAFCSENVRKASIAFSPLYIGTTNTWKRKSQTKQSSFKLEYKTDSQFVLLCDEQWKVKRGVENDASKLPKFCILLKKRQSGENLHRGGKGPPQPGKKHFEQGTTLMGGREAVSLLSPVASSSCPGRWGSIGQWS